MESALLAGTLASGATLAVALSVYHLTRGVRATVQRRITTFIKGGGAPAAALPIGDTGGGRRRARRAGAAVEKRSRLLRFLDRALERAESELTARELLIACGLFGVLVFALVGLLTGLPPLGLPLGILGLYLPILWLRFRAGSLAKRFHTQLPDTVSLLASAVRAGNALPRAFERVSLEAPEPTRTAFRATVREMGLGAPLEEALDRLVERFPSSDMELFVASINVQYQVGGNLTRVLDLIAETLRERARILGDIRSLTSQQRYSAYLLSALPVVVSAGLYFLSREYMAVLFEGPLRILLVIAATMIVMGYLIMQQLAKVDV